MNILFQIYLASLILVSAAGLYTYKSLSHNIKWFVPYFIFVTFFEFANSFNLLLINRSNAWCYNLESIMEFILFGLFLISLPQKRILPGLQFTFMGIGLIVIFFDLFFLHGLWMRNNIAEVSDNLIILIMIFIYYRHLLNHPPDNGLILFRHPPFLVVTGLFFYFIATTFYYACYSFIVYNHNTFLLMLGSTIPAVANLLFNTFVILSFVCSLKTKKLFL